MKDGAGRETELRRSELEYQQVEAAALQLQSELDLEDARRQQIEARQTAHQQDLELAQLELARANVVAPFSGIISEVFVEAGQYVRPGEPLLKLTNIDRVEIPLPLPVSRSGPIAELLRQGHEPRVQLAEHEAAECRWVARVNAHRPGGQREHPHCGRLRGGRQHHWSRAAASGDVRACPDRIGSAGRTAPDSAGGDHRRGGVRRRGPPPARLRTR